MAERRMFHTSVVESDAFLDLPVSSQALYFHLGMHADDDGFINGPKQIARSVGASAYDLDVLVKHNFLFRFDDILVVVHWLVANTLKADRLKPLRYPDIAANIYVEENRIYSKKGDSQSRSLLGMRLEAMESKCKRVESKRNPKVIEGKVTEGKVTEDKVTEDNIKEDKAADAALEFATAAADNFCELKYMGGKLGKGVVLLSDEQIEDLLDKLGLDGFDHYVEKLAAFILKNDAKVKNHYATILRWWQEDRGVTYENQSFEEKSLRGVYEGILPGTV